MGNVKVELNYGMIDARYKRSITQAQKWLDNEIIADTSPYTPFMTGALNKSARVVKDGEIEYNAPYANRMYHGDNFTFNQSHNRLAGPYWFERSKAVNKQKWVDGVRSIVKLRKGDSL